MTDVERKRRRVLLLQRYLLNPPVRLAVRLGLVPGYVLLETTGRRTGKRRRTVVGALRDGDELWVVAEQGLHAGWVRNIETTPSVRVLIARRWHRATAAVDEADDAQARLERFGRPTHARIVRRYGTALRSVRIRLDD
jgi:deazaflavin-dependent oxidoreductase (nitroreductase family)